MEVKYNPWNVTSLEAFHFYNCPECDDKYATKEQFVGHTVSLNRGVGFVGRKKISFGMSIKYTHGLRFWL